MQPDNRTRHQRLEKQVGKAASPPDRPIKIPLEDFNWIHVSSYMAFFWDYKFVYLFFISDQYHIRVLSFGIIIFFIISCRQI